MFCGADWFFWFLHCFFFSYLAGSVGCHTVCSRCHVSIIIGITVYATNLLEAFARFWAGSNPCYNLVFHIHCAHLLDWRCGSLHEVKKGIITSGYHPEYQTTKFTVKITGYFDVTRATLPNLVSSCVPAGFPSSCFSACLIFLTVNWWNSPTLLGGGFNIFFIFTLKSGKMNPIWRYNIFQMGGNQPPTNWIQLLLVFELEEFLHLKFPPRGGWPERPCHQAGTLAVCYCAVTVDSTSGKPQRWWWKGGPNGPSSAVCRNGEKI